MIDYEIKSQRPTANGQTLFLVEIKAKVFHTVSKVQNMLCIRKEYMSFHVSTRKEVSVIKCTVMG